MSMPIRMSEPPMESLSVSQIKKKKKVFKSSRRNILSHTKPNERGVGVAVSNKLKSLKDIWNHMDISELNLLDSLTELENGKMISCLYTMFCGKKEVMVMLQDGEVLDGLQPDDVYSENMSVNLGDSCVLLIRVNVSKGTLDGVDVKKVTMNSPRSAWIYRNYDESVHLEDFNNRLMQQFFEDFAI